MPEDFLEVIFGRGRLRPPSSWTEEEDEEVEERSGSWSWSWSAWEVVVTLGSEGDGFSEAILLSEVENCPHKFSTDCSEGFRASVME